MAFEDAIRREADRATQQGARDRRIHAAREEDRRRHENQKAEVRRAVSLIVREAAGHLKERGHQGWPIIEWGVPKNLWLKSGRRIHGQCIDRCWLLPAMIEEITEGGLYDPGPTPAWSKIAITESGDLFTAGSAGILKNIPTDTMKGPYEWTQPYRIRLTQGSKWSAPEYSKPQTEYRTVPDGTEFGPLGAYLETYQNYSITERNQQGISLIESLAVNDAKEPLDATGGQVQAADINSSYRPRGERSSSLLPYLDKPRFNRLEDTIAYGVHSLLKSDLS